MIFLPLMRSLMCAHLRSTAKITSPTRFLSLSWTTKNAHASVFSTSPILSRPPNKVLPSVAAASANTSTATLPTKTSALRHWCIVGVAGCVRPAWRWCCRPWDGTCIRFKADTRAFAPKFVGHSPRTFQPYPSSCLQAQQAAEKLDCLGLYNNKARRSSISKPWPNIADRS